MRKLDLDDACNERDYEEEKIVIDKKLKELIEKYKSKWLNALTTNMKYIQKIINT